MEPGRTCIKQQKELERNIKSSKMNYKKNNINGEYQERNMEIPSDELDRNLNLKVQHESSILNATFIIY